MTNRRKTKRLRVVAGQGTGESPRSGRLQAVGSEAVAHGTRVRGRELPAMPETAASSVHVITVSLRGAVPPLWRRLELPSAITFHQLHEVLTETFGWSEFVPHSFVTNYGEFGGPVRPASRAAKRAAERLDESGVTLVQAGDSEGAEILYLHGYDDEWRVEITVHRIRPAAPGVACPRCTGGQGEDTPGDYLDLREFNAEREESAQDFGPDVDFYPDELTDILVDLLTPDSCL